MRYDVRAREVTVLLGSIAAIGVVTAALAAVPDVSPTTAALALLLVVLGAATLTRLRSAVVVSLIAMLTLNFFFLPPVGTLVIAHLQNWIALFAFLVVAIIASNLSAAAQARAQEAIARRNEVTRLFDLTRDVLLTTDTTAAIEVLARHVARRFELSRVAVCLPVEHGWGVHQGGRNVLPVDPERLSEALARARRTVEFDARQRAYGGYTSLPGEPVILIPLRHGTNAIGLLAVDAEMVDLGTLDAVAGVVAIAIERTQFLNEREAAELVRQRAELAATLLASISHDLKTPLTAMRVAIENLAGDLDPEERRGQALAALAESDRLNRVFQDILDMARIDAAAVEIERQWVTPSDVVDAAVAQVRHTLGHHPLRIQAEAETAVEIDPRIVSLALSHLLENAARYSAADREIDVKAHADAEGLRISVSDQGVGLDPAELDQLFERFFRGRRVRQLAPGTGMGLAITRGLLNAVGGTVGADNVPGGGATFTIVVPGRTRPLMVQQ